jgi:hypothetical protein
MRKSRIDIKTTVIILVILILNQFYINYDAGRSLYEPFHLFFAYAAVATMMGYRKVRDDDDE